MSEGSKTGLTECLIALPLSVPVALLQAKTTQCLWFWFIVPAVGLKPIGMANAYGLSLICSFLTMQYDDKPPSPIVGLTWRALLCCLVLAFGYTAHWLGS